MLPTYRQPTHPGEILLEEFLKPLELTPEALAIHLEIPTQQMKKIIQGEEEISELEASRECDRIFTHANAMLLTQAMRASNVK